MIHLLSASEITVLIVSRLKMQIFVHEKITSNAGRETLLAGGEC